MSARPSPVASPADTPTPPVNETSNAKTLRTRTSV
jgi:hypothetical protein